ncbi:hypothetical protein [Bradymonas sediminis]|uniref:hypothetical protein n=1 Tax=Bradymonas sediminis TaxID=1548548 RepID=UPI0013A6FCAF|nr:hypothetical protein [Bradymonas sediminis]
MKKAKNKISRKLIYKKPQLTYHSTLAAIIRGTSGNEVDGSTPADRGNNPGD